MTKLIKKDFWIKDVLQFFKRRLRKNTFADKCKPLDQNKQKMVQKLLRVGRRRGFKCFAPLKIVSTTKTFFELCQRRGGWRQPSPQFVVCKKYPLLRFPNEDGEI